MLTKDYIQVLKYLEAEYPDSYFDHEGVVGAHQGHTVYSRIWKNKNISCVYSDNMRSPPISSDEGMYVLYNVRLQQIIKDLPVDIIIYNPDLNLSSIMKTFLIGGKIAILSEGFDELIKAQVPDETIKSIILNCLSKIEEVCSKSSYFNPDYSGLPQVFEKYKHYL